MTAQPMFNPMDPAFVRDPYPAYRLLRERAPVWKSPLGVWVLTRYEDIARLLKDQRFVHDSAGDERREKPNHCADQNRNKYENELHAIGF